MRCFHFTKTKIIATSSPGSGPTWYPGYYIRSTPNLVPRACDPWEGNEGSGIIRCRKPGILAKIELRIHFNGQSDSSLKRIIPEPSFPSQGSQARGTRLLNPNLVPRACLRFLPKDRRLGERDWLTPCFRPESFRAKFRNRSGE